MLKHPVVLGVEGGGTKTDWVLLKQEADSLIVVDQGQLPATNFKLITLDQLQRTIGMLPSNADRVGVFLAGCVTSEDRTRLRSIVDGIWPHSRNVVGSDRESGFAAAFRDGDGIVVISGSGSAVTGRKEGKIENAGGRGHLLGDRGGGYTICLEGLRLVLRTYDLEHRVTPLAKEILRALMLNRMEDLISWTQTADKLAVSALSPVMFWAAANGDHGMLKIIESGAASLAQYTESVARWLQFKSPAVKLMGGVFLHQPLYVDLYNRELSPLLKTSAIDTCETVGAWGAGWLAARNRSRGTEALVVKQSAEQREDSELKQAETEQINPRSALMDQLNTTELIDLFISEEHFVTEALKSQRKKLEEAVDLIVSVFQNGGRLFYVGAGTSGRIGALDASEIPPTFGEPGDRVQAIIAGGPSALHSSVEGAEDNEEVARMSIVQRGVCALDVVCGITASGRTPFVLSAMHEAKNLGAKTILLTCNPSRMHHEDFHVEIDLPTGPELITGSTRLKAGTATKISLNILSSCSLIRLGRTQGSWMTNMNPSNAKLRYRAIRIVSALRKVSQEEAEKLLETANWNVQTVLKS